jgi:predicted HTH transcriptional regulator
MMKQNNITETNRIEYKQELTEELEKEVVAFLNYKEGGFVYIGIDKYGRTVGVADADRDMLKIKDRLRTNIVPSCLGLFDVCLEEKEGNYVAYLLADENIVSIKLAKYRGTDRCELIENKEFGNCSLIKATKQLWDRLEVENTIFAKITSLERMERRLWNQVALREAVINAIVHNDYSSEVFPKFEIFDDRIEITSYGSLPIELSKDDFFKGASVPRNKELMRIFKDVELVEYLGSGMPRILKAYGKRSFKFMDNFLRIIFKKEIPFEDNATVDAQVSIPVNVPVNVPVNATVDATVNAQVERLLIILDIEKEVATKAIMEQLVLKQKQGFWRNYLQPALKAGLIEMTIPDKPNSRLQKYRLTPLGIALKKKIKISG